MTERQQVDQQAREFFQDLWIRGDYCTRELEYEKPVSHTSLRCSMGAAIRASSRSAAARGISRLLARIADQIVALDIALAAIERHAP